MNPFRWLASWVLFWLGHFASVIMLVYSHDDYKYAAQWVGFWYPIYNQLMIWSYDVQNKGPGAWNVD